VRAAPKWEMVVDWWVSPWGGDGDGGGRKYAGEGRGGSVAVGEREPLREGQARVAQCAWFNLV
jgi:hypothetical protein